MTTVISEFNTNGERRACDSKCHNAHPLTPCRCVCEGVNHGKAWGLSSGDNYQVKADGDLFDFVQLKKG